MKVSSSLKLLVNEYLSKYVNLYGLDAFIPKMHFLVHYPDQMMKVGPMVRTVFLLICIQVYLKYILRQDIIIKRP